VFLLTVILTLVLLSEWLLIRCNLVSLNICQHETNSKDLHFHDLKSRAKKLDEGRENIAANTLRGTLLLRMAISRTLAKDRDRHPIEGSLPSSLAKGISIVKKLKERALSLPGKLPAPSILLILL
jgi:hypothetical protein